ncbi:MAG: class I SAM-dependent methyltransferase [Bacteroidia bacterium]|nr:class I SAM-dependent methyltransferase [Bacteroidia bacterium]
MKLLTPHQDWKDYELIDSGDGEKLERFGTVVTRRPEPQAVWSKFLSEEEWKRRAHAHFVQEGSHSGKWDRKAHVQDQWYINYHYKGMKLRFRLGLTGFKHVGIFPEQAINWNYIYHASKGMSKPRVLNLFAYTGGASLAARAGGADVIHCDSIKNVLNWANVNMQASGLSDIRWLLEDAFKFVKREAKRGNSYQGIILDPPAYGHGPKGEKWKLEDMVNELSSEVGRILDPEQNFLVFNSYSLGFSPLVIQNLVRTHFKKHDLKNIESGELFMPEKSGRKLPMGIFTRFKNV